jgi:hypothetical protein
MHTLEFFRRNKTPTDRSPLVMAAVVCAVGAKAIELRHWTLAIGCARWVTAALSAFARAAARSENSPECDVELVGTSSMVNSLAPFDRGRAMQGANDISHAFESQNSDPLPSERVFSSSTATRASASRKKDRVA